MPPSPRRASPACTAWVELLPKRWVSSGHSARGIAELARRAEHARAATDFLLNNHIVEPRLFEPKSPLPGNEILSAETKVPKLLRTDQRDPTKVSVAGGQNFQGRDKGAETASKVQGLLYLLKGKPLFLYNFLDLQRFRWEGQQVLAPGKHTIAFDFK